MWTYIPVLEDHFIVTYYGPEKGLEVSLHMNGTLQVNGQRDLAHDVI